MMISNSAPTPLFGQTPKNKSLQLRQRERHPMTASESHSYQLALKADQYFSLRVEQLGIDVVVDVFGPNGKLIEEFDSPNGDRGPEVVTLVAPAAGNYRVEIHSLDPKARAGSYEIELEEIRASEARDKQFQLARQHSKDLADKLEQAVAKRDDDEVVKRFQDGVIELAHPAAEPVLLLIRATEAVQLPVAYLARGDYQHGAALAGRLLELAEKNLPSNNPVFAATLIVSIRFAMEMVDYDRAAALMAKASTFLNKNTTDEGTYLTFLELQGRLQTVQGQPFTAEITLQKAVAEVENLSVENTPLGFNAYFALGDAYAKDLNYGQAEAAFRKALEIGQRIPPGDSDFEIGYVLAGLGQINMAQGKYQEAGPSLERAARVFEQHFGANHPETVQVQALLACTEMFLRNDSAAQPLFDRSMKVLETTFGQDSPKLMPIWQWWGLALSAAGKDDSAKEVNRHLENLRSPQK
jgi:tetratricopeptide (TPR) repeat protein